MAMAEDLQDFVGKDAMILKPYATLTKLATTMSQKQALKPKPSDATKTDRGCCYGITNHANETGKKSETGVMQGL